MRCRAHARGIERLPLKPSQVDHQFVGGLIPVRRPLFQGLADNALQLLGHFGIEACGRWGFAAENLSNNGGARIARKCAPTCRHLVQHRAKGKYVTARIQLFALGLFRRHIADGAEDRAS